MLKIILPLVIVLFVGCGGSSSSSDTPKSPTIESQSIQNKSKLVNGVIAKNTLLKEAIQNINGQKVEVKTDVALEADELSKDFVVVSGKINGKEVNSYLNYNYLKKNAKISVEVYDNSGKLLAASEPKVVDKDIVDFGELTTK